MSEENRRSVILKSALFLTALCKETKNTSWELLKIMIPVVVVVKIFQELGIVTFFSHFLDPVMGILGFPGVLGLVWATAMVTNLYGVMVVFVTLAPSLELSTVQMTVLCSALLFAHALPLELAITKRSGVPFLPIAVIRLIGAILYAFLLHLLFNSFGLLQEPAVIIFADKIQNPGFLAWGLAQVKNVALITLVIFVVLVVMKILYFLKILTLLEKFLELVLPFLGMSWNAVPVTEVGMVMGISYGGALIIKEAHSGRLNPREIFFHWHCDGALSCPD